MEEIESIPKEQIIYVDETVIDSYLYREYDWSAKGQTLLTKISGRRYQRTGIVAAQLNTKIIAALQYNATMNSTLFELWFSQQLCSNLTAHSVIVMDNAAFHGKSKLFSLVQNSGHTLVFLPLYSLELNPIEHFWAWLKRKLRDFLRLGISLDDAIVESFKVY